MVVWQQTGPSKVISSLASWRDYWGALAWLPPGRVILPPLPVMVLAVPGPQPCVKQSPELSRRRLRHQKLWGCLPTWTFITRRVSSKNKDISYHQFSRTRSSSLRWLRQCSGLVKPPVVSKVLPPTRSHEASSAPPQPGGGGPEQQVLKSDEPVPSTSQPSPQVPEKISEASNTDSDGADEPRPERELPRRSLKVRLPLKLLKRGHQTTASSSKDGVAPSKVRKETEAKEAEVGTLIGPSEAALQKAQFELYQKDLPAVQEVRARILKLQEGEVVTQRVLDSSPTFHLRRAGGRRDSSTHCHR